MLFLLIPVAVLAIAAIIIFLITRFRPNTGLCWGVSTIAAIAVWGWMVYLNGTPETAFGIASLNLTLGFVLDNISWTYMISQAILLAFILFTAPSRLNPDFSTSFWGYGLLLSLIGVVGAASDGGWSVIICWVAFDLLLIGIHLRKKEQGISSVPIRDTLRINFSSTFLAILSLTISSAGTMNNLFANNYQATANALLLLSCALRAGMLPIQKPQTGMNETYAGFETLRRLTAVTVSFPLLARISTRVLGNESYQVLLSFATIAALVSALGWMRDDRLSQKRIYFVAFSASFAFISAIRFNQTSALIWSVSLIVLGGPFLLYKIRSKVLDIIMLILMVLYSGLPFTPVAEAWQGIVLTPASFTDTMLVIAFACMLAGILFLVQKKEPDTTEIHDRWLGTIYPFGFIFSVLSFIMIAHLSWRFLDFSGIPWPPILAMIIAVIIRVSTRWLPFIPAVHQFMTWFTAAIQTIWKGLAWIVEFRWAEKIGRLASWAAASSTHAVSVTFEGQNGILWEFLVLIVLLVIIMGSGS